MRDIMIDLETMGSGPEAAIIAIGGVAMDLEEGQLGNHFYLVVDLESSVAAGGVMDPATVTWWLRQSEAARSLFLESTTTVSIRAALKALSDWIAAQGDAPRIWGNGSSFDNVILASAYRRMGMPVPWRYLDERCYRTVKALHPHIQLVRQGTHHNALHDALDQAKHLVRILGGSQA